MLVILNRFKKALLYLSTVIGLLMIFDEIVPAFLNLSYVLQTSIEIVKWVRDFFFFPFDWISFKIFSFKFHPILKSYFFIGILLWRLYNKAHLAICGMEGPTGIRSLILFTNRKIAMKLIIWQIVTWPYNGYQLVEHFLKGGMKTERNVYSYWIKSLITLLKLTFLIAFMNFGYNKIKEQLAPQIQQKEIIKTTEKIKTFNYERLQYLRKMPILDGTIYIENYYTQLKIGGKNIEQVEFNGMGCNGEDLNFEFDHLDKAFAYPIFKEPIIEFSFRSKLYRVTIIKKMGQFYYDLTEVISTKMKLENKYDD